MFAALALIAAAPASVRRTPDGHPDLQGIWANDTVTMLERPSRFGNKAVFSKQEAIAVWAPVPSRQGRGAADGGGVNALVHHTVTGRRAGRGNDAARAAGLLSIAA